MIANLSMDRRLRRHDNIYSGAKPNQTVFFPRMHLISLLNITHNTTCNETDALRQQRLRQLLAEVATATGTKIEADITLSGEAFRLDESDPLVDAFHGGYGAVTGRARLEAGNKLFVDDGNAFYSMRKTPVITCMH